MPVNACGNHRLTEIFGLEGRSFSAILMQWAGISSTRWSCSELCPKWSWVFPGMEHPPSLWASYLCFTGLVVKAFFIISNVNQTSGSLKVVLLVQSNCCSVSEVNLQLLKVPLKLVCPALQYIFLLLYQSLSRSFLFFWHISWEPLESYFPVYHNEL